MRQSWRPAHRPPRPDIQASHRRIDLCRRVDRLAGHSADPATRCAGAAALRRAPQNRGRQAGARRWHRHAQAALDGKTDQAPLDHRIAGGAAALWGAIETANWLDRL